MYRKAAEFIMEQTTRRPKIAMILGSGLGAVAEAVQDATVIPYRQIPHFPISTVHQGNLLIGSFAGHDVLCMQGRVHYYEGYSMQEIVLPIHAMRAMGVQTLLLTNASGGICSDYTPGQIVCISDHIKFGLESPMQGENPPELGERFFDMTRAYAPHLRQLAKQGAEELGFALSEGVYAYMGGPQFETPAEIQMLRLLGADLVGMSTVPETIAAAHCCMDVLALSCVTNMAAGMEQGGFDKAVIAKAEIGGQQMMKKLLTKVVEKL